MSSTARDDFRDWVVALLGEGTLPPESFRHDARLRESLRRVGRIRELTDEVELHLVRRLRLQHALTWRELADDLGVSTQTAHRRFAAAVGRRPHDGAGQPAVLRR